MYLLVRCRLVTTPWSGVICRASHTPPLRHAVSTMYRCLKCDRYVIAFDLRCDVVRFALRSKLCVRSSPVGALGEATSSSLLVDVSSALDARPRFCNHGCSVSMSSVGESGSFRSSCESCLNEYFWHNSLQAPSSLTSSRHFLETWEARARVVGSSTHSRICKVCQPLMHTLAQAAVQATYPQGQLGWKH